MKRKLANYAFGYAILAMVLGVFYREFTKFNQFTGVTMLSVLHTHTFILGMVMFLLILLLEGQYQLSSNKNFSKFLLFYNIGLIWTIVVMIVHGTMDVLGQPTNAMIAGIAGLGHIILGVGIIYFFIILRKQISIKG